MRLCDRSRAVRRLLLLLVCLTPSALAEASLPLLDFEPDRSDAGIVDRRTNTGRELTLSSEFATSGERSLLFAAEAWQMGREMWPSFKMQVVDERWRQSDRLMFDVINPQAKKAFFGLLVNGRRPIPYDWAFPACGYRRVVLSVSDLARRIRPSTPLILHVHTERPTSPLRLHIDNVRLLQVGEQPPALAESFVRQMKKAFLDGMLRPVMASLEDLQGMERNAARLGEIETELAAVEESIRSCRCGDDLNAVLEGGRRRLTALRREIARIGSVEQFRRESIELGDCSPPMRVGFATAMQKLSPRDMPFNVRVTRGWELAAARNETESFQVAVLADGQRLGRVRVEVGRLRSENGYVLPTDAVDVEVVGFVRTRQLPGYRVQYDYVGWWPDVLLDFLDHADVAAGDVQSFWVRVRVPENQPAGVYRGTIRVLADHIDAVQRRLTFRVYDFSLPKHSLLPLAIRTYQANNNSQYARLLGTEWNKLGADRKNAYADFLARYYLTLDDIYRSNSYSLPEFDILERMKKEGRLVAFNLGQFKVRGMRGKSGAELDAAIDEHIQGRRFRELYNEAKRRGLLNHAYMYGCDELGEDWFPLIQRYAAELKRRFPGVPVLTTARAWPNVYGVGTGAEAVDGWIPITHRYFPHRARKARRQGRKVWWYQCCVNDPLPQFVIERPAIHPRLLMGLMAAKYRPDGFLYYEMCMWHRNDKPITSGPFTEWDPVSYVSNGGRRVFHGDGSWMCPGPDGRLLATIRLENFRDGLEDYAYYRLFKQCVGNNQAPHVLPEDHRAWWSDARPANELPDYVVRDLSRYSTDPADLYRYRSTLAELIETAVPPGVDPPGGATGPGTHPQNGHDRGGEVNGSRRTELLPCEDVAEDSR